MILGRKERYCKTVLAVNMKLSVTEAMENTFPSFWQPLDDFKKTWFTRLLKKIGLADQNNNIVEDKFYQKKPWIDKVMREINTLPTTQFMDPQNYPATLNQPYFKPDLQFLG